MQLLKKQKLFFILIFITSSLLGYEPKCKLKNEFLYAIAENEKHRSKDVGYPYLISFNNKKDAKRVKKYLLMLEGKWLDWRTYDCKNKELCSDISEILINHGVSNLDLGHMQISYYWHPMKLSYYFDFNKSNEKACLIIKDLVSKYGMSWKTIGKYHNFNDKRNKKYREKIKRNLNIHT